ncbi:hypothetical protein B484DRAFT_446882 [Ochromonadaceae sp. CCMP2298]|nr:hypothetical protein B484DRAFT_446882 [Ochromonadaceae sp. CCMP2298]|mmetsp:Transcript_1501/g.3208  ORF Transcript_1501/g.3208 Transcript_1501/m.3208 type:complete len:712 (-) Transcript_1501:124-2259(-)
MLAGSPVMPGPHSEALEQLGLTPRATQYTQGKAGAERLGFALAKIIDTNTGAPLRIAIASAICEWQSAVTKELRLQALKKHQSQLFDTLRQLLIKPDDSAADYSTSGALMPAHYLCLAVRKEAEEKRRVDVAELMLPDVNTAITALLDVSCNMAEGAPLSSAGAVRAGCLLNLVESYPLKVETAKVLKSAAATLLRLHNSLFSAPVLKLCCAKKMAAMTVEAEGSIARLDTLWDGQVPNILTAIKGGSSEMKVVLQKNKAVYSAKSKTVENYLSDFVDVLGLDDLGDLLQEIADYDPYKLVKSIPKFLSQLASTVMKHKFLILGLFLAIALVVGSGPLLPVLGSVAGLCGLTPQLFIPFFKLLTVISGAGEEQAIQCLYLVAKVAKSGLVTAPENMSAVLDTVNIIKDKFKYSNVFQPETLKVLEGFAGSNMPAFNNILTWNQGKAAKRGNNKDFLVNAGRITPLAEESMLSRMLSPSKDKGAPTPTAKLGAISPSPQSQNMQLLSQAPQSTTPSTPSTPSTPASSFSLFSSARAPAPVSLSVPATVTESKTPTPTSDSAPAPEMSFAEFCAMQKAGGAKPAPASDEIRQPVIVAASPGAMSPPANGTTMSPTLSAMNGMNSPTLMAMRAAEAKEKEDRSTAKRGSILLSVGNLFNRKSAAVANDPSAPKATPTRVVAVAPLSASSLREAEMAQQLATLGRSISTLETRLS